MRRARLGQLGTLGAEHDEAVVADELEVGDVVTLGGEDLPDDGLALDLVLAEGVNGLGRDEAVPLLILFWDLSGLKAAQSLFRVETTTRRRQRLIAPRIRGG